MGNHDVLQEVDHLVLIRKVVVEEHGGGENEHRQERCDELRAIPQEQQCAATDLSDNSEQPPSAGAGSPTLWIYPTVASIEVSLPTPLIRNGAPIRMRPTKGR